MMNTPFSKKRRKSLRTDSPRKLLLESLEGRRLLAADVLFVDSFEAGQWAGNWIEDNQNDWFTSSQRSTDGSYSAEVDGRATNATLTLSSPIDLNGYTSAELTFDWLIEGGFDSGEYLALDVSSDGGASWQTDVLRLNGNSSPENTWHNENVDLTPYISSGLLVRFRAKVSNSNEDANVDNVKISATSAQTELSINDVQIAEGDSGITSMIFTVSRLGDVSAESTVDFATTDGSAAAGVDYNAAAGTLTFPAGDSSPQTIAVQISGDSSAEPDETLWINLSNPGNATLTDSQGEGTILDDDTVETISYANFSDSSELNVLMNAASPVGPANVLQLTPLITSQRGAAWHTSKQLVSLGFSMTFDFQATANGSDGFAFVIQNDAVDSIGSGGGGLGYRNLPNSLALEFDTYQNGSADPDNNHVSVQTLGTSPNSNDTAASLGYVTPSFDINDGNTHQVRVIYHPGTMDVFLDDFSSPALSVPIDLAATLSLDAGRAWLGFTGVSGGAAQQHDILNWHYSALANPQTSIAIDDAQVVEGNSGTTNLAFTVTRSGNTNGSSTVNWGTTDGSATTADYVADSGQTVFLAGETEKTINVTVNGDTGEETHETFSVTLSEPSGAELTDDLAVGTILNDDTTISISDDAVTEADTSTRFLGEFASATAAQLYQSRGMEFGPDGNLYVSRFDDPGVLRFDGQTGAPLGVFATHPQLTAAKNIEFGPDGNLYVADSINHSVARFNGTTGAFIDVFVSASAGGLMTPRGLAFDDLGDLYVSSAGTSQILRFDRAMGAFLGDFVAAGSGGLVSPTELTFGDDGHLYVASGGHQTDNSILRYDGNTGAFLNTFVSPGSAGLTIAPTGGVIFGQDVNGDSNSDLWVSNGDVDEVMVFDGVSGAYLATPVTAGLGGVDDPKGLAFDPDGNLLVVDNGNNRILRYGAASQAALTVSLSSPSAVTVVADFGTADGTAGAGEDYIASSGALTFLPGETTKTIMVSTFDDSLEESDETFFVNLTNAVAGTISDAQGVGTILDDNSPIVTSELFVYDIRFDSKRGGKDHRAVFEIRTDSDDSGLGTSNDDPVAGVDITVTFAGTTYSGTTDSNGVFRTPWVRNTPAGDHYANAVDLALAGYVWDPLDLDLENDSDGDGKPDDVLTI